MKQTSSKQMYEVNSYPSSNLLLHHTAFMQLNTAAKRCKRSCPSSVIKFVWVSALCGLFDKKRQSPQNRWLHGVHIKLYYFSCRCGPKSCSAHCSRPARLQKVWLHTSGVNYSRSARAEQSAKQRPRNFCTKHLFKFMPPDLFSYPICTINNCKFIYIAR